MLVVILMLSVDGVDGKCQARWRGGERKREEGEGGEGRGTGKDRGTEREGRVSDY